MVYYGVQLLRLDFKLDGLTTHIISSGACFFFFVWPLCDVLIRVFLEYFTLICRVSGYMHQAYLFCTGRLIARMACMICLALARAAHIGLVIEADSPPLRFLTRLEWLASSLMVVLEGVPS